MSVLATTSDESSPRVQLARRLSPSDPLHAFTPTTGLVLVGPFEVLGVLGSEQAMSGFSTAIPSSAPELHLGWRFPFDPPEVMTVIVSTNPQAGTPLRHGHTRMLALSVAQ